jgi:hypothetical protein
VPAANAAEIAGPDRAPFDEIITNYLRRMDDDQSALTLAPVTSLERKNN